MKPSEVAQANEESLYGVEPSGSKHPTDIHHRHHHKREKDYLHKLNQHDKVWATHTQQDLPIKVANCVRPTPSMQGIRDDSITIHKLALIVSPYFQVTSSLILPLSYEKCHFYFLQTTFNRLSYSKKNINSKINILWLKTFNDKPDYKKITFTQKFWIRQMVKHDDYMSKCDTFDGTEGVIN
jgi:hypothetical protein